jgi:dipeptidyl aminopeptidase/acylaminoacyl peptidase
MKRFARAASLPLLVTVALIAGCAASPRDRSADRVAAPTAAAQAAALMPREVLFGNPERTGGSISPDGRWLGWIAPRDGVLNVYVAPASDPAQARAITNDRLRGVRFFSFAYTGQHILYAQDEGGDENFQVRAVALDSGAETALSPKGSRAQVAGLSPQLPDEVLLSVNDRNKSYFDLVRVNLRTGATTRVVRNDEFAEFVTDDTFRPRYAQKQNPDGGNSWFVRRADKWEPWGTVPQEDSLTTSAFGLSRDGSTLYLQDSRGRNTGALFAIDTASNARKLVHEDARADVDGMLVDPRSGLVQAVSVNYLRDEWTVIDPTIAKDIENLTRLAAGGEFSVNSRTLDDRIWVVSISRSDAATTFHLYDRASGQAKLWFDTRPALAGARLAKMQTAEIRSRDGLTLPSYYTLPPGSDADNDGVPERPLPMVLLVHGGPWARDFYGLNGTHQWLANRGYAVLSVNFRASTGFGKAFINAGDLQWGRKMHDDLIDGVNWAAARGIAQRDKIAIMGGSYGGYSALAGVTMTPKDFACGVAIVGPSNLITLLNTIPPYWGPIRRQFTTRVGDPDTEAGRALLKERSPLTYVQQIERPLLIGQGANDPRVNQAESDQIVQAMRAKNIPVTYVLYPDEGHGFARPQNRLSFNAATEEFLGTCLGGRVEAVGDDLAGASITVPTGLDLLPGLKAAMAGSERTP